MPAKRTRRILTRTLIVLCLSIGIFVFIFKQRISDVYDNTIEPTPFQNVVLEKDTAENSTLPIKNLPEDSSFMEQHTKPSVFSNGETTSNKQFPDKTIKFPQESSSLATPGIPKRIGKEIKSSEIPLIHAYNSRIRLSMFLKVFKEGDYISGMEFSNLYRRDPTISKLTKSTICGFIEKNIHHLTRNGNAFVIQTIDPNGIHTKLKIPFVEDLRINIDNGAQVIIGDAFTSKAPAFSKSILLPIQLQLIDILHNGEQFPTSGYISGDYYFIDYSKTKMAYKLK
jgi:hypothetical protein